MTDIARLGIQIDSSQTVSAKRALDDFSASGKTAAAAAADLHKVTSSAATGANSMAKASAAAAAGARQMSNDAKNLAYQLVDVGQGVLMGQRPFQIFAQQAGQIGQVIATSPKGLGGLLKELGGSFAGLLTPARLAGVTVVATGAAVYAAYENWKSFTLQLDDTARAAGTSTQSLSALQAAASFKGISGTDFTKGIDSFSKSVYDAKNNAGGLADVFRANNVAVGDFDDSLAKAANLIRNAKDDQQRLVLLQQMGLPATMQWARLLSGGAEGLAKAKDSAAEFAANDSAVQKARQFDENWNKAWTNFGTNARSAFQHALDYSNGFFDEMDRKAKYVGNAKFWQNFYDPKSAAAAGVTLNSSFDQRFAGDSRNPASSNFALQDDLSRRAASLRGDATIDPNKIRNSIALQMQYIGPLGTTPSAPAQKERNDSPDHRRAA